MTTIPRCRQQGQALAELAIFGSIMLIALAFLVRVGLQLMYSQEATHQGFRLAMAEAQRQQPVGSGSAQIIFDRYIPDPSRPLAIGQQTPFTGGGSISWSNRRLMDVVNDDAELPRAAFYYSGSRIELKAAEFLAYRTPRVRNGYSAIFKRVARIYCNEDANSDDDFEQCAEAIHLATRRIEDSTVQWRGMTIPVVGLPPGSNFNSGTSIVIDNCAGQIADAESCKIRCERLRGTYRNRWGNVITRRPELPVPPYCPPLDNPANFQRLIDYPHGIDLNNTSQTTAINSRITATNLRRQTVSHDEAQVVGWRGLRYQMNTWITMVQNFFNISPELPVRRKTETWETP